MSSIEIAIINGPNLNLLGSREPSVYGHRDFDSFLEELRAANEQVTIHYFQSNVEGEIINALQKYATHCKGILLNAAGYSHTSIAIADAVSAIVVPVVEIHISNIHAREAYRHHSFVAEKAVGVIAGLGLSGYWLGLQWLLQEQ
jgi:3-dehydroquinate dehydratase-2